MPESTIEDKLLTTRFVANAFSVDIETVGDWIRQGKLKGIKVNGYWRIPESSYIAFVQKKYGPKAS